MATLSLIAEPFPDWEAPLHLAAAYDLADALAATAPRSCSTRVLVGRGTEVPNFASPRLAVEQLPIRATALPIIWQSGGTARPLDGEMTHAVTPMMPLRSRSEDDGTQSTITLPHMLAWDAPELLTASQVRLYRAFVKRAVKHADRIITTTHAAASILQDRYGYHLPVQVIPPAVPTPLVPGSDASSRRERLGLPSRYLVTTAHDDDLGRLRWIYNAYSLDSTLPPLVVLTGLDPVAGGSGGSRGSGGSGGSQGTSLVDRVPEPLRNKITVVPIDVSDASSLADAGAAIAGATLFLQPQAFAATCYAIIAALAAGVPVLHAGLEPVSEHVLDAGLAESEETGFITALTRLFILSSGDGDSELERLTVQAADRSRAFSWHAVAWQIWETHASI